MNVKRSSVLIVDDDPEVPRMIAAALSPSVSLDSVSDGAAAITELDQRSYAVIVLDLIMPHGGGGAVLRHLEQRRSAERPVILVVSGASELVIESVSPESVHGVIRKPFDPLELAGLIESCIEVQNRRDFDAMLALFVAGMPLLQLLKDQ